MIDPFAPAMLLLAPLFGSFAGLLSVRMPAGEPFMGGRSHCRDCGHELSATELVPIISFLALRGRCAHCRAPIAPRYPLIEAGFLAIAIAASLLFRGPAVVAASVFGWQLLLLAVLDFEHFWLPDPLIAVLGVSGLAEAAFFEPERLLAGLIGAGAGFLALFLIARLYRLWRRREGLGGGDPKLLAAIGAWLGWRDLPMTLLLAGSFGLGAVLVLRLAGRRLDAQSPLPFGALLAPAAFVLWLARPPGG